MLLLNINSKPYMGSPMALSNLTLSELERSKSRSLKILVYIYFPVAYYHFNLDVTKENLLAAGFSAVPAVFLVCSQFIVPVFGFIL